MTALFDLLLVGLVLAVTTNSWCALLGVPFLIAKLTEAGSHLNPVLRLARVAGGSLRALVIFGVLLAGSIRYRRLVI